MIHFLSNINWDVVMILGLWLMLSFFPKATKHMILATAGIVSFFIVAFIIILSNGTMVSKYDSKYFVIDVQKKKSGNYRIIVNKKYNALKSAKNILYTK